jgi:hypothetical protein
MFFCMLSWLDIRVLRHRIVLLLRRCCRRCECRRDLLPSCHCECYSNVDLGEEDLNGCWWVPLVLHSVQVPVHFGPRGATISGVRVCQEVEACCITDSNDGIEDRTYVKFGHIGLKLVAKGLVNI